MKFTLYEESASGEKTKIYSPIIEGEELTLYEKFVDENVGRHKKEVENIDDRLLAIGNDCGLFGEFFDTKAGKFGENLCTLKDRPRSKLRLYFIEYGNSAIILGSGGEKPKSVKATQDVKKLDDENRLIGLVSRTLQKAEKRGHFSVNDDGSINSTTNFTYDTEDYG